MAINARYLVGLVLWGVSAAAFAACDAAATSPTGVMNNFACAATTINGRAVDAAIITAAAALTMQWLLTYSKEVFNGDISNTLAKSVGLISWFGATMFLIKNQTLMGGMLDQYLNFAGSLSGTNLRADDFTPGGIMLNGIKTVGKVDAYVAVAMGNHFWQIGQNIVGAIMLVFADIFVLFAFMVVALAVFVAQSEFWIMFAVAPLAFGLIPLSAFRDQGFAPIKGVISLGLRIIILGMIIGIINGLSNSLMSTLSNFSPSDALSSMGLSGSESTSVFSPVWYYMASVAGCAFMSLSAGKIASSIASGSASFSGSDAIKAGMQAASTAAMVGAGVGAAKVAMSAMGAGGAAKAAGALGQRALSMLGGGGPHMGVSPSKPGGGGGGGGGGGDKLGGPINGGGAGGEAPAFSVDSAAGAPAAAAESPASSSGSAESAPRLGGPTTPSFGGNASSAGIGGAQPSSLEKTVADLAKAVQGKEPTAMQKLGGATRAAAEQNAQDNHSVGVSINTRGE